MLKAIFKFEVQFLFREKMMIARKMEKMELGIGKLFDQTFLAENLTLWFDADKKKDFL